MSDAGKHIAAFAVFKRSESESKESETEQNISMINRISGLCIQAGITITTTNWNTNFSGKLYAAIEAARQALEGLQLCNNSSENILEEVGGEGGEEKLEATTKKLLVNALNEVNGLTETTPELNAEINEAEELLRNVNDDKINILNMTGILLDDD